MDYNKYRSMAAKASMRQEEDEDEEPEDGFGEEAVGGMLMGLGGNEDIAETANNVAAIVRATRKPPKAKPV